MGKTFKYKLGTLVWVINRTNKKLHQGEIIERISKESFLDTRFSYVVSASLKEIGCFEERDVFDCETRGNEVLTILADIL